jgi:hypothetical protein
MPMDATPDTITEAEIDALCASWASGVEGERYADQLARARAWLAQYHIPPTAESVPDADWLDDLAPLDPAED